ncbi:MAG: hypothetical protein ACLFR1_07085 [Spirochaetia bacterium]
MARKKGFGCIIGLVIFFVILGLIALFARFFLPQIMARVLLSPDGGALIPQELTQDLREGRGDVLASLDNMGITREEAIQIVDSIESDDVNRALDRVQQERPSMEEPRDVFRVFLEELRLPALEVERVMAQIPQDQLTWDDADELIRNVNESRMGIPVMLPVVKEFAREYLTEGFE